MPLHLVPEPKPQPQPLVPSLEERMFIMSTFGVGGSCGCDGGVDTGCPLCTEERERGFLTELRALVRKYR